MDRWIGKVAVVTGASAGIGKSVALALANNGLVVVAMARRQEVLKELIASTKGTIHPLKCDVSDEADVIRAFKWIEKEFGGVDVLVNNAGVALSAPLVSGSSDDWKSMMNTNYFGLCVCTKEALKTMRLRGDNGHIFHMNSIGGHYVKPEVAKLGLGFYMGTKFAITAITEAIRVELANLKSNVKITSISPGATLTDMYKGVPNLKMAIIQPSDVADAVMYALGTGPNVQVHDLIVQAVGT